MSTYKRLFNCLLCILENRARKEIRTDYRWLQVDEYRSRNVFASAGLAEESVKAVVATTDSLVGWHLSIRLDAMLQTVEFPAGISNLYSSLTNVN